MILEQMVELLILKKVLDDYYEYSEYQEWLQNNYNVEEINNRYSRLGKEFLSDYALNKAEKSD